MFCYSIIQDLVVKYHPRHYHMPYQKGKWVNHVMNYWWYCCNTTEQPPTVSVWTLYWTTFRISFYLPQGNKPQKVLVEKDSHCYHNGSSSWLYRTIPSAKHKPFVAIEQGNLTNDFDKQQSNPNQVSYHDIIVGCSAMQ